MPDTSLAPGDRWPLSVASALERESNKNGSESAVSKRVSRRTAYGDGKPIPFLKVCIIANKIAISFDSANSRNEEDVTGQDGANKKQQSSSSRVKYGSHGVGG